MAEVEKNESVENEISRSPSGRKWALIGCLLMVIFIIAIVVVIFWVGSLSATPGSDTIGP